MAFSRAGFLIYSGIIPLLKTLFTILFGYILARKGMFTPANSRGASYITMNIGMPALIFSNIIPAFSPSNLSYIAPLLLSAFVYQGIGFLFGFIIREVCYVPRNFYQGLIILTGMSNWGNLPTAVVTTVTQEHPFDPTFDPALGISFISIFTVAFHVVFWGLGAAHSLSWDFLPNVPQGEAAERRVSWKEKPIGGWIARVLPGHTSVISGIGSNKQAELIKEIAKDDLQESCEPSKAMSGRHSDHTLHPTDPDIQLAAHISSSSMATFCSRQPSAPVLPAFRNQARSTLSDQHDIKPHGPRHSLARICRPLSTIVTPMTVTIASSIPISLFQPLRALFVDTTQVGGPNWKGPDGRPPLYFVIDTAAFVGSITVPMALVLLGASFARVSITRPLSRYAFPAMFAAAFAKMFLLPVIGIFMVREMVHRGFIPKDNKTERFVAMFLSGTPAAVNQLIVTQLYAPDGNVDTLSAFLLVQYVLMFFSSAPLAATSLALL